MFRRSLILIAVALASFTVADTPSFAQGRRTARAPQPAPNVAPRREDQPHAAQAQPGGHHVGGWLRKYRGLSPAEQQTALENDPQFRNLPPERQEKLRQRLQHFNSLPPAQQDRILNRMETWEHLTPAQKQQARELFGKLRQLPPERRQMLGSAIRDLRSMPPEQRQQQIDSDRFKSTFSPDERDLLNQASQLPLAPVEGGANEQQDE